MLQPFTNINHIMQNKKTVIILVSATFVMGCLFWFGYNFAPGSYPYAEEYEINVNESKLIEAIEDFKKDNPQYIVPEQTQLIDGRYNETGQNYWYHIYFYNREENKIVKCWSRPSQTGKTTFALIGVSYGLELGNWKMINKDFRHSENKEEKEEFEERILNKIKEKL